MTGWKMWEHNVPDSNVIVLSELPERDKEQRVQWQCKCNLCGTIFTCNGKSLRNGNTKSCGCLVQIKAQQRQKDITGNIYGFLTVLSKNEKRKWNKIIYHCKCICGNECDVDRWSLISGNTTSCGCKRNKRVSQLNFKDLTGQQFGHLTVLELMPERDNDGRCQWLCQCSCGNIVIVSSHALLSHNTISCGCIKSIGESYIYKILKKNNFNFLYNKGYFTDLVSDTGRVLRYDFIIFQNNLPVRLIEFDGPQHQLEVEFYGGKEKLELTKKYDAIKNNYALSHNIPLVRIPYTERDNITLEMIMGDKYLIKEDNNNKD